MTSVVPANDWTGPDCRVPEVRKEDIRISRNQTRTELKEGW